MILFQSDCYQQVWYGEQLPCQNTNDLWAPVRNCWAIDQNDPPEPPSPLDCNNRAVGSVYNDHFHEDLPRIKCDCSAANVANTNNQSLFLRLFAGWL